MTNTEYCPCGRLVGAHVCPVTYAELERQLSAANAAIAMKDAAIKYAIDDLTIRANLSDDDSLNIGQGCLDQMHAALSTTPESIAALEAEKQAKWNEESNSLIGQQDVQIESLQRQVAILTNMFQSVWVVIPKEVYFDKATIDSANAKLSNTQATAEAYDRELAAKVLESLVTELKDGDECERYVAIGLRGRILNLRATKQVKE